MSRRKTLRELGKYALAAAFAVASFAPIEASAQVLRFSKTTTGGLAATGNTLGLSKDLNLNGPGTHDSIGTFLALDSTSVDNVPANPTNPWPAGTTWDWTKNGSTNSLVVPGDSQVLYAELVWAGSDQYVTDVTSFLNNPVTLGVGAQTTQVTPDATTAVTIATTSTQGFAANYYLRSADVTTFVGQHGSGSYTVSGVPATEDTTINSLSAAGWTLVVAYSDSNEPVRNLTIFVGGSFVDENSQQDYSFSGFCAPPTGSVGGKAIVSTLEGDANLTGDQLLISKTAAGPFANLSGPNNPASNFFASQINGADGKLDTSGSFGSKNHDAVAGTMIAGGRQGWDLTTVPLSSASNQLANNQTAAVLRTITTGDSYVPVLAAFAIDVTSPDFTQGSSLSANAATVKNGDSFTVTATLHNTGDVSTDIAFVMPLESGLSLTSYTTDGANGDAKGQAVVATQLNTGVDAGTLAPGATRTVVVTLKVTAAPSFSKNFGFSATWKYSYVTCTGKPPISDGWAMPFLAVAYDSGPDAGTGGSAGATGTGGAATGGAGGAAGSAASGGASGSAGAAASGGSSATGGSAGAAGSAASTGSGGKSGGAGTATDSSGCSCSFPGGERGTAASLLLGLGLAAAAARRRRR